MGSSWVLVHVVVSLLVLLGSAAKDEHNIGQREMSFDTIMQEMQSPDTFVMQQEADLTDLIDPKEFVIEQEPDMLDTPRGRGSRPGAMSPRRRHPGFGPRSHPPVLDYHVQFPLGRPTSDNLEALCLHGDLRPRYPNSFFPSSGFGQQRRRASAVNNAEAWFGTCCKDNQTWGREVTLCCATQAWELSLETFCEEDSSVKDRLYHCCRQTGIERLLCFQNDAQNPSYEPTEALPVVPLPATFDFSFDRNTCHSTQQSVSGSRETQPSTSQKSDINFPPGRPNEDNVEGLCRNQKLRPLFSLKCLPNTGYEMVARQAKMINRVEKGFKQCCKKKQDVVACAEHKWRAELNRFCSSKKGGKADHHCCRGVSAGDRFHCFQSTSPDPQYNMTLSSEELAPKVCKARKIIKKVLPLDFPVQYILNECCALAPQNQNSCFFQKVEGTSNRMCSSRMRLASPSAARHKDPMEVPKCITDFVMDVITKSTKVSNQKKNKRCPI
ncbi:extracellular matrix protein 1-like [Dunckerocampus dactyliophorus]|uniref:extracellular matrix protein 1-like n=1 Tax=Dunckerocampus dactyliophorus TaxID=161453 RepID=UPI002404F82F|nr:extracellular matrix protein 1-like [Dunckerocampus dactyliophorus]